MRVMYTYVYVYIYMHVGAYTHIHKKMSPSKAVIKSEISVSKKHRNDMPKKTGLG